MKITLPWPPSVNGYWRSLPRGRVCCQILSKRGREYRHSVGIRVLEKFEGWPNSESRMVATITLHPPTARRFDLDNFGKAILDALQHAGVYRDDSQIDDLRIVRGEKRPGGAAVVEINELKETR